MLGPLTMSRIGANGTKLPPRVERALELAYRVEGVIAARVWQWPGRVAVGVVAGKSASPADLLRRVEAAVSVLREPDELWDFGILDGEMNQMRSSATPSIQPTSSPRK
jgi:hypothetical protein